MELEQKTWCLRFYTLTIWYIKQWNCKIKYMHKIRNLQIANKSLPICYDQHSPSRQLGLCLYFSDIQINTTAAFSTASAIADNVDPPILSTSIHTSTPSFCQNIKFFLWKTVKFPNQSRIISIVYQSIKNMEWDNSNFCFIALIARSHFV